MRRSEADRMTAVHGCVVAADRRAMSAGSHSRQRKPQWVLVAGEPVFVHRRKDGAQGWCGPGVCVLSEEPKPGRNETVWVHMRNCLHKCNRTQVRPATNEEAEGIETVTSPLPDLTEAVREGRTRHFADITDEGDCEDDEPMVVEGDVMDVRREDQIRSLNRSSMHLQIPTPHHIVPDQRGARGRGLDFSRH